MDDIIGHMWSVFIYVISIYVLYMLYDRYIKLAKMFIH